MRTIWVLGDQLNRTIGPLADATPQTARILIVESRRKLQSKRWHVQRAHLVLTAMRRFADELRTEGFEVDLRQADSLPQGLADHREAFQPAEILAMEPASWDGKVMLEANGVVLSRSDQFSVIPRSSRRGPRAASS